MIDYDALFDLSYSICVVGASDNGKINACIVNTVFQITPDPATVAISVNKENFTHDMIKNSGNFSVSVVSQDAPMREFAPFGFKSGKDIDKFSDVKYRLGKTGCPILQENMTCYIEVEVMDTLDIYTHTVFIGKVISAEKIDDSAVPMTYSYYRDIKHGKTPKKATTYHGSE